MADTFLKWCLGLPELVSSGEEDKSRITYVHVIVRAPQYIFLLYTSQ